MGLPTFVWLESLADSSVDLRPRALIADLGSLCVKEAVAVGPDPGERSPGRKQSGSGRARIGTCPAPAAWNHPHDPGKTLADMPLSCWPDVAVRRLTLPTAASSAVRAVTDAAAATEIAHRHPRVLGPVPLGDLPPEAHASSRRAVRKEDVAHVETADLQQPQVRSEREGGPRVVLRMRGHRPPQAPLLGFGRDLGKILGGEPRKGGDRPGPFLPVEGAFRGRTALAGEGQAL